MLKRNQASETAKKKKARRKICETMGLVHSHCSANVFHFTLHIKEAKIKYDRYAKRVRFTLERHHRTTERTPTATNWNVRVYLSVLI